MCLVFLNLNFISNVLVLTIDQKQKKLRHTKKFTVCIFISLHSMLCFEFKIVSFVFTFNVQPLHFTLSRFGHSVRESGITHRFPKQYDKSPCMFSLQSMSYWLEASPGHIANAT